MAAPVSEETRKLLERAQRAIDEARELREQRSRTWTNVKPRFSCLDCT